MRRSGLLILALSALACDPPETDDSGTGSTGDTGTQQETGEPGETGETGETGDTGPDNRDCSGGSGWEPGGFTSEVDGLSVMVLVPEDLPACAPVLAFGHGGTSCGRIIQGDWNDPQGTGLEDLAATMGFVLIIPGVREGEDYDHTWSTSMAEPINAHFQQAWEMADIDRNRTWFYGQSAGGHMAVYMGLYAEGTATGIAVIGAGDAGVSYPSQEPSVKLPFYVGHDPTDSVVPYQYSESLVADLEIHGHEYIFEDWSLGGSGHGLTPELSAAVVEWLDGR